MDVIKKWVLTLIITCFVGAIILYLSSSNNFNSSLKTIVSLSIVVAFLLPVLTKTDFDFSEYELQFESAEDEISDNITQQMLEYAELEAVDYVSDIIINNNAISKKIECIANIDDNNSIFISEIKITLESKYKSLKNEINEEIKSMFDIYGEFIWV